MFRRRQNLSEMVPFVRSPQAPNFLECVVSETLEEKWVKSLMRPGRCALIVLTIFAEEERKRLFGN